MSLIHSSIHVVTATAVVTMETIDTDMKIKTVCSILHTHTVILTDEREMVIMQADQTTIIHRKVILCDTELQDKAVKTNTEARYDAEDSRDDNTLRYEAKKTSTKLTK